MATSTPTTTIPNPSFSPIYKPLNTSVFEIRLLVVPFSMLRNLGQEDPEPLSGRLVHHQLPIGSRSTARKFVQAVTRRNYTALSYVWGDPHHTHEIIIDGLKVPITYSLYSAIRQLQCDFMFGDEAIWVDAICIDQSNHMEKSAQISLMREVYHNASTVRVWLGPVHEEDEDRIYQVMQWIQILNNGFLPDKYEKGSNEWWEEKYLPVLVKPFGVVAHTTLSGWHKINMFQETFNPASDENSTKIREWELEDAERFSKEFLDWRPRPKDLEAFMKLVPNGDLSIVAEAIERYIIREPEWFTRIWVVQEVGVAWDDVDVARGPYSQSWGDMLNIIFYLHYTCNVPFPSIDKVTRLEILRLGFRDGKRRRLRELMYECRFRRATDPRDKVYGLYGLMGDKSNIFTKPDYSKSIEEVFAHTTFHFITQAKSLNPICGQQRSGKRKGLPSWVPDYELDLELASAGLLPRDGGEAIFHAAGFDDRSEYELPDPEMSLLEWTLLPTRGIRIGVITHLSEASEESDTLSQIQRRWRKTLDEYLFSQTLKPGQTQSSSLDAVAELVDQYNAYHSPGPSNSPPNPPQISASRQMNQTPEIDLEDPITLSYLAVLTTARKSPTTRASAPYISFLPPLVSSHTQTTLPSPPPPPSQTAPSSSPPNQLLTSSLATRSSTSLFSIPRKPLAQNSITDRAATMPTLSSSSSSSTPYTSVPIASSIPNTATSTNIPRNINLITTPKTTTATDHTTTLQQNPLQNAQIRETCLALEAGMRRERCFVMSVVGDEGCVKIGSAGEEVRVGDIVVVLYGCDVPVILRSVGGDEEWEDEIVEERESGKPGATEGRKEPGWIRVIRERKEKRDRENAERERRWELVGEAFVEGFMDAEALAWLVKGRGRVEGFGIV